MRKFQFKSAALLLAVCAFLCATASAQSGAKNEIEAIGKIISIDPIKGDVTIRMEFFPHGSFEKEDGTLGKTIKFDTFSSNGKQEITFDKGKRISPTEIVLNMYDGVVEDYPFDTHKANLVMFFTVKPDKPADKPKEAAPTEGEKKPEEAVEETEVEVPFTLTFAPTMPGYTITTAKSKDSDETFIDLEMTIVRSGMVKIFSVFVSLLMILVTIAVVVFTGTVVLKDRKVEIAMMSFIGTLLFAFVAVRNSQPAVPPVGILTDYLSFFWAEAVLAICLLTMIFTWVMRPNK